MHQITCEGCGARYKAPDHLAGKSLRCKRCEQAISVPGPAAVASAAAPESGLEVDPSMLELALQKEAPRAKAANPAAPKLDPEEAKFASLLSQIDSGEEAEPVSLPPAPRQSRAERKAAKQRMKEIRATQAAGAAAVTGSGEPAIAQFTGPASLDRGDERYGRDELSKMLVIASVVMYILLFIGGIVKVIRDAKASGQELTFNPQALLYLLGIILLFVAIFLIILVPSAMLGTIVTSKMMRFRLMGQTYLNTMGWIFVPPFCAGTGFLVGGEIGLIFGGLFGSLLTFPALGYLNGLRFLETIVAWGMTYLCSMVVYVILFMILMTIGVSLSLYDLHGTSDHSPPPNHSYSSVERPSPSSAPATTASPSTTTAQRPPDPDPLSPFEQTLHDAAEGYGSARAAALMELAHMEPTDEHRPAVSRALNRALAGSLPRDDKTTALQAAIHWDINGLDAHLIAALDAYDKSAWLPAAQTLAEQKNPAALPPLIEKLRREPEAAKLIASYGESAEPIVRQALSEAHLDSARLPLIRLLAEVGTAASVEAIKPHAESRTEELAEAARAAWRKLTPETYDAVGLALADLASSASGRSALGLAALAQAEPDDEQRPRVVNAILDYADGYHDESHRPIVARALATWKDPVTVHKLKVWLQEDASTYERRTAIDVLSRWQEPSALPMIELWLIKETDLAVQALIRYEREAEAPMVELLSHRNEQVAKAACRVLAEVGTTQCLGRLRNVARGNRPGPAAEAQLAIATIEAREKD